jgi:hypothetical protein
MAMDVAPSMQPKVYASNPRPRPEREPTTRNLVSALRALAIVVGLLATPASASTKASPTASTVVDRTTLKVCWTPDAAVQLQQPTYCWTFDNDELGAV